MSLNKSLFSSDKQDWETPQPLFDLLDREFNFTLDVCATKGNAKVERFFDADGLGKDWGLNVCWMNPSYGSEIGLWLGKAYRSSQAGATVVCLIPARTDTEYWHKYVMMAEEVRFIEGRLKFVGAKSSAPFPSCIVIFRGPLDSQNVYNVPMMESLKLNKTERGF